MNNCYSQIAEVGLMGDIYVTYNALFMIEYQNIIVGQEYITDDEVRTFFLNQISQARAKNILTDLFRWGFISRIKKKRKKGRRGPRQYLYKINKKGIKKCEYLRTLGYELKIQKPNEETRQQVL